MFQNQQRPSFALSTQYTQGNCKELTDDISHNHQWPVLFPAESIEHFIETYCNSTTITLHTTGSGLAYQTINWQQFIMNKLPRAFQNQNFNA